MSGVIQMTGLGHFGRFGNQVIEVAFLHAYARRYGLTVEAPRWVGNLFYEGLETQPVRRRLPTWNEQYDERDNPIAPVGDELVNKNLAGYAQYHTSYYSSGERAVIGNMFRVRKEVEARLLPAFGYINHLSPEGPLIGIHLRRGDYGQLAYYITPVEWYLRWLEQYWTTWDRPVLFVASEDPSLVAAFAKYDPQTTETLGIKLSNEPLPHYNYLNKDWSSREPLQMDFFPDFYLLSRCDVLLIPNSSFSFAAAMVNPWLKQCARSSLPLAGFEWIDPWNAWPLQRDLVEDYLHVPGIARARNEYWHYSEGYKQITKGAK